MKPSSILPIFACISGILGLRPSSIFSLEEHLARSNKGIPFDAKIMETENLFNPKMDYDEWTPLGRGDPLKNDPTYDYVPPVLERVHYWMDLNKRTPDPPLPNSGVLVLGSRTESTFTARPTTPRYQPFHAKETQADSRIDTSSLLDPFFKLMDVPQFGMHFNSNIQKQTANRIQRPQYPTKQRTPPPQALQRPPYTMLMPPPPPLASPSHHTFLASQTNFTTGKPSASFDKVSNRTSTTPITQTSKNTTTISLSALANTENVFKPVAISMPGQMEPSKNDTHNNKKSTLQLRQTQKKPTTENTITSFATTTPHNSKKPYESDGKFAQQQIINYNHLHEATTTAKYKPFKNFIQSAEGEEQEGKKTNKTISRTKWPETGQRVPGHHTPTENDFPRVKYPYENNLRATTAIATTSATTTTTATEFSTLTTDPLFKHYKQPTDPLKSPFYLIIQGHSKVKTYGASKNPVNTLLTSNEIKHDEDERKKLLIDTLEKKARKLALGILNQNSENNDVENLEARKEAPSFPLSEEDNLESLEEAFPKSKGGSSKKRYLGSNHRRKRLAPRTRRQIPEEDSREGKDNIADRAENLDLDSLIAVEDDYDSKDVADILLSSQGSGFGSSFARSQKQNTEG